MQTHTHTQQGTQKLLEVLDMSITLIIVTIMGVYIYPNSLIYTLNMCRFLYINFASKKLLTTKQQN
jgi:hypothetical protein